MEVDLDLEEQFTSVLKALLHCFVYFSRISPPDDVLCGLRMTGCDRPGDSSWSEL